MDSFNALILFMLVFSFIMEELRRQDKFAEANGLFYNIWFFIARAGLVAGVALS